MSTFLKLPFFFLGTAVLARAQTAPAVAVSDIQHLDSFVVSAGLDGKTAFDLAQGTSILAGDELRRRTAATLGATLAATPGLSETSFGPGASRPVIRGLGGDRVRMLDNGVGSLDASSVSPDHNVAVEPLLVDRIEILRGPATLLYGSSAVGGVVNIIDNRIPSAAPAQPLTGRTELRFGSAARERTGIVTLTGGGQTFALQVNGLRSETDDLKIPGYADPAHPANRGTLTHSAISTKSASVGGTTFWSGGNLGLAVSAYDTVYGVPVGEPIAIDLKQRRADLRSELTRPFGPFKSAKLRFGLADYTHAEVNTTTGQPNTTFKNKAYEGRVELAQHDRGALTGTVGLQTSRSDFSAVGAEVVTPPYITVSHALFALESYQLSPELSLQFGGRYEFQRISLGAVDPALPAYPGYAARSRQKRTDDGLSFSAGTVYYPAKNYSVGFSATYSQRLPVAQEIFSNGPHGGTGAYEIGTSLLGKETSVGLELTLRKRAGIVTGSGSVFMNRFADFVFEQRDPARYFDGDSGTFVSYSVPPGDDFLPIYQFIAKDALFYGAEAEIQFHLIDRDGQRLHVSLLGDTVRAEQTTDHVPLPRIPPARLGLGFGYEQGRWTFGAEARHAFAQTRFTAEETRTAGYTLVGAHAEYHVPAVAGSRVGLELFLRAENLTDATARLATSFLKDVAPLAGRNLTLGARLSF